MDAAAERIIFKISSNPALNFLKKRNTLLEFDILNIASIVFNIEKAIKLGYKIENVEIPISAYTDTDRDFDKISQLLHDLFTYVLIEDIDIEFKVVYMKNRRRGHFRGYNECENVCLFSGGVDSLSGLLSSKNHFGEVRGVSVVHGDQTWGSHIIQYLNKEISKIEKIQTNVLYAPTMGSYGYSQLRGFLYVLYGAIFVSLLNAKNLIIAECGPTMYQPQFSPYDSVTMTTHPFVMNNVKQVIKILMKRDVDIILPHENMTKSEVMMASPYKDLFKHSHSCISLRFGTNEGTCYGCAIRRLGFLVSGIEDTIYTYDPIGKNANVENLISLLRFSYDILFDYENMDDYSKQIIKVNRKKDLFKRFALDNFAGIYEYNKTIGKLNPYVKRIFDDAMDQMNESRVTNRIKKVRKTTFKPNFNKFV